MVKVNQPYGCTASMLSEEVWCLFSHSYWREWETHHQFELKFSAARNLRKFLLRTLISLIFQIKHYFSKQNLPKTDSKILWCLQLLEWDQESKEGERYFCSFALRTATLFNFTFIHAGYERYHGSVHADLSRCWDWFWYWSWVNGYQGHWLDELLYGLYTSCT